MNEGHSILVPKYFADVFNRKLSIEEQASPRIRAMVERIYKLIDQALDGLLNMDWVISGTKYRSALVNEPYGIETDDVMTYLYGEVAWEKITYRSV